MFFILTNSRSFSVEETTKVHQDIAARVAKVARELGQDFMIISRGDSTLRGHYPLETQLLADGLTKNEGVVIDGEIICPFFPEGGRYTMDNIHYVKRAGQPGSSRYDGICQGQNLRLQILRPYRICGGKNRRKVP